MLLLVYDVFNVLDRSLAFSLHPSEIVTGRTSWGPGSDPQFVADAHHPQGDEERPDGQQADRA